MPIVSRNLDYARPQADGRLRCRVSAVDAIGRNWIHGPFFAADLTEAQLIRDTVTWDLASADFADLLVWVQGGSPNTVAAFDYTNRDLTQAKGEERMMVWFATETSEPATTVAWWLDDIPTGTFNTIGGRVGYSGLELADITNRFTFLLQAEPWVDVFTEPPDTWSPD